MLSQGQKLKYKNIFCLWKLCFDNAKPGTKQSFQSNILSFTTAFNSAVRNKDHQTQRLKRRLFQFILRSFERLLLDNGGQMPIWKVLHSLSCTMFGGVLQSINVIKSWARNS